MPPLIVNFTHRNLPARSKSFNGNKIRLNTHGEIYLDDKQIAAYYRGFDGEYYRVWDDETFYKVFSDMEIRVDAIPGP